MRKITGIFLTVLLDAFQSRVERLCERIVKKVRPLCPAICVTQITGPGITHISCYCWLHYYILLCLNLEKKQLY